jgi:hypothetical protein
VIPCAIGTPQVPLAQELIATGCGNAVRTWKPDLRTHPVEREERGQREDDADILQLRMGPGGPNRGRVLRLVDADPAPRAARSRPRAADSEEGAHPCGQHPEARER